MAVTREEITTLANTVAQQAVLEITEVLGLEVGKETTDDEKEALVLALTLTTANLEAYLKGCITDKFMRQNTRRVLETLAEKIGAQFQDALTAALECDTLSTESSSDGSDTTPAPDNAPQGQE